MFSSVLITLEYIYIYVKRLSQNRFDLIPTFYHSSRGKVLGQNEMFRPNVHTLVKKIMLRFFCSVI